MSGMNMERVKHDMTNGLAYVCAMCAKWHRARDKGETQCEAASRGVACGGPLAKMTFPEYEGPLEGANWADFCFRCGSKSAAGVQVPGQFRTMGICEAHLKMLEDMVPEGEWHCKMNVEHVDVQVVGGGR